MSENRRREWLDVTRLEAEHSYRFPLAEFLIVLFVYISFTAIYLVLVSPNTIGAEPGPMWNGTIQVGYMTAYQQSLGTFVFSRALEQFWMTLLILVPLLVSYTTTKTFEDGSLRTLLSYPVRRSHLLLMRVLLPVLMLGSMTTVSALLALLILIPAPLDLGALLSLTSTYWLALLLLTCSVVFLSVLTRRMVITAIGGITLWFGLFSLGLLPDTHPIVTWVSNPVRLMRQHLLWEETSPWRHSVGGSAAPPIGDVFLMVSVVSLVIMVFLVVSIFVFRRMEV